MHIRPQEFSSLTMEKNNKAIEIHMLMRTEHKVLLTRSHHTSHSAKNNTALKQKLSENLKKCHLEQQYLGSLIAHGNGLHEFLVSNYLTEQEFLVQWEKDFASLLHTWLPIFWKLSSSALLP